MTPDRWAPYGANILASADGSIDMPVGNVADFPLVPRAVWVGGSGTIQVILLKDADDKVRNLEIPAAGFYAFRPRRLVDNGGIANIWGVK